MKKKKLLPFKIFFFSSLGLSAIAMIVYSLSVCVLNQIAVRKHLSYKIPVIKTLLKPFAASVVMGAVAFGAYYGVYYFIHSNFIALIVSVVLGVLVYFVLVIKLKVVTEEELAGLPKGAMISKVAKKLHLL